MADLPEYKERTKIQPGDVAEFSSSMANVGKSWEGVAQLGNALAQSAANDRARISGLERGLTSPGQNLLPSFGQADEQYIKAYQAQEQAVATSSGFNALDKMARDISKNPKSLSLMVYDQTVQDYIKNTTDNLSKENGLIVRQQLEVAAAKNRAELENKIIETGHKAQIADFTRYFKDSSDHISSLVQSGELGAAKKTAELTKRYIDEISQSIPEITHDAKLELKRNLDDLLLQQEAKKEVFDSYAKGKEPIAILNKYAKAAKTRETVLQASAALDAYKEYNALTRARDDLLTTQALGALQRDKFTDADLAILKSQITEQSFADFEVKAWNHLKENKEGVDVLGYMNANADNAGSLSTLTAKQLNAGYDKAVKDASTVTGRPLSLQEEGIVAAKWDTSVPKFNNKLSASINSRNPEYSVQAAQVYEALMKHNPNVVAGVDSSSALRAGIINSQIRANAAPIDAWKLASDNIDNLSKAEIIERGELYKEQIKNKGLEAPSSQKNFIAKRMGFDKANIPDGLRTDFMASLENNYKVSKDWDESIKVASEQMHRSYKETTINGFKEVMYLAPDRDLPTVFVRNLMIQKAQALFNAQREGVINAELPFYYKFPDGEIVEVSDISRESMLSSRLDPVSEEDIKRQRDVDIPSFPLIGRDTSRQIECVRVQDGKEIKGTLLVRPNKFTDTPPPGQGPAYSYMFLENGKSQPVLVYNPEDFSNAQFTITAKDYESFNTVDKAYQETLFRIQKEIMKKRSDIIGLRDELGEDQYYNE